MDFTIYGCIYYFVIYSGHCKACVDILNPLSYGHIDSLVQDCSNSIANALELLQSCTKPLI